jgi:hypothetical protein
MKENMKIAELRNLWKKEDAYQGRMNKVQRSSEYSYAHTLPVYGYRIVFQEYTIISGG